MQIALPLHIQAGIQVECIAIEFSTVFNVNTIHSKSWRPWRPVSANFFHFPPKFRLGKQKPSRPHCTNASPSFCRRWFVFNINTSHIDLLFLTNWRWKTRICVIYTFLSHLFLSQFMHFFRQTDSANSSTLRMYGHDVMMSWWHEDMMTWSLILDHDHTPFV